MKANHIESKFAMMGARLKVSVLPEQRVSGDYAVDIQRDRRGEYFELRVPEALSQRLDVNVLQTDKRDRHLLLFVRPPEGKPARFLCGHDEREWFVAAVPGGASTVRQAKEALKPRAIRSLQTSDRPQSAYPAGEPAQKRSVSPPGRMVLCAGQCLAAGPHQREVHPDQRTASSRYW